MSSLPMPFDVLYWGIAFSNALLGFTLLQGWIYFQHNDDKLSMRMFVAFLVILDIVNAVLSSEIGRVFWIVNFGKDILHLPLSVTAPAEGAGSTLLIAMVQLFFASRVYLLNSRKWLIPGIIVIFSLASLVSGLLFAVYFGRHPYIVNFGDSTMKIEVAAFFTFTLIGDLVTTFFLLHKFHTSKSYIVRSTCRILEDLITTFVTRGVLVTAIQIITVIIYILYPGELYWAPLHFILSRVYIITMIAMLNGRRERKLMDLEGGHSNVAISLSSQSQMLFAPGKTRSDVSSSIEISCTQVVSVS